MFPVVDLYPDCIDAYNVFCRCATQWRIVAGMGGAVHQGIDYTALETVMNFLNISDKSAVFDDVQYIEHGALKGFSEKNAAG